MKRITLIVVLVTFVTSAWAQALEILPLHHRSAEMLLPQLQPLVEPGGMLTGAGDKLFLRASNRNRAEIRQVLDALDRPLRRLMITVRHGGTAEGEKVGAGATVTLSPGDSSLRARVGERRYTNRESISQQVQTVEGGRAFINVGQSVLLPLRQVVLTPAGAVLTESVVQYDIGTGFHAEPRVVGDSVTLDISPRHDTPGVVAGSANVQRLSTTVTGRLGEWIALGGAARDSSAEKAGTLHYGTRNARDDRQIWLKVEELGP
ncbi:MAG: hypothetical protein KJ787_00320 [Gammaproteobacteria bacterium]|nr:hypothetical protein [Gammaproteobacteria bacterium]MBU1644761.1 hypothetical protein [Gammaproteobacteria bacterium]